MNYIEKQTHNSGQLQKWKIHSKDDNRIKIYIQCQYLFDSM